MQQRVLLGQVVHHAAHEVVGEQSRHAGGRQAGQQEGEHLKSQVPGDGVRGGAVQGVPASTHLRSCEDVNKFCSHTTSQKTAAAPALAAAPRATSGTRAAQTECTRGCAEVEESSAGSRRSRCARSHSASRPRGAGGSTLQRAASSAGRRSQSARASSTASASAACHSRSLSGWARCDAARRAAPLAGWSATRRGLARP